MSLKSNKEKKMYLFPSLRQKSKLLSPLTLSNQKEVIGFPKRREIALSIFGIHGGSLNGLAKIKFARSFRYVLS